MKVVFLGTPDFAIPALKTLLEDEMFEVVGVVTQPDKPRGRSKKLTPCATKAFAMENNLPVFSFDKIRDKDSREQIEILEPDVMVTAAYGQILTQKVLDIPKLGCVNVHGSLLPKYRGAAPIQWAIINGEEKTGITTMLTERGLDCGDILLKVETEIKPNETAGELFDRLAQMGGDILVNTLKGIAENTIVPKKQDEEQATHFPMLKKEDGKIDWNKSAKQVHNQIRGVNPWPSAYTTFNDKTIKIWKSEVIEGKSCECGKIVRCDDVLDVACNDGVVRILEMQIPGKKRMSTQIILRGFDIGCGDYFI